MLDFHKVMLQIDQVGRDSLIDDRLPRREIIAAAHEAFVEAARKSEAMTAKLAKNRSLVLWPVALPLEPFGEHVKIEMKNEPVTVVATDGSQIMPSRHEVYSCYLLNIGVAVISYGVKLPPILDTEPRLYHRPEDLYPLVDRRRVHIDELYVSLERNLLELETLASVAVKQKDRALPVVALVDGSLIPWSVEKMPGGYQEAFLGRMEAALDLLKEANIPLIGYISQSRSSDLINDLRIWKCPYKLSNCRELCGHLNEEEFPCSTVWPLADRHFLAQSLQEKERTGAFLSGASASRSLPPIHHICFAYVNLGYEIARLEFPRWLADDPDALSLAISTVISQVEKGRGYPVSLAEAHNLAVIKAPDRTRFFELIGRHLVKLGVRKVSVSPKESRKRQSII